MIVPRLPLTYNIKLSVIVLLTALWFAGCSSTQEIPAANGASPEEPQTAQSVVDKTLWKSAENQDKALAYFIEGSIHEENGQFEKALASYRKAVLHDDDPSIFAALARTHVHTGDARAALVYAKEAVQRDPDKTDYRRQLAQLYMLMGNNDSAAVHLSAVIEQEPSDKQARYSLAQMYEESDPERAMEIYEDLQQRIGDDWNLSTRLAELYSKSGRLNEAADELETLLRLDPGNAVVMQTMASMYIQMREFNKALELYETLAEQAPGNVTYILGVAEAHLHMSNWDAASRAMRNALESPQIKKDDAMRIGEIYFQQTIANPARIVEAIDALMLLKKKYPDEWMPSWYLGALMFNNGQYDHAAAHLSDALERDPENTQIMDVLARAYLATGNFDGAADVLGTIVEQGGANGDTYIQLGYVYRKLGRNADAVEAFARAIEIEPESMDARASLASLYDDMKQFEKSDALYDETLRMFEEGNIKRGPAYYTMLNNYAYALSERGVRLDRAMEMARRAVEAQPKNSSFLDTIGWVHFKAGNFMKARDYIEKAIIARQEQGLEPGPVLYHHLGDVYLELGQADRARRYWENALANDPDNMDLKEKLQRDQQ